MFDKSVDDVLKVASKVVTDLELAAKRAEDKAEVKNTQVQKLKTEVQELDAEAERGNTVAARFRDLITV